MVLSGFQNRIFVILKILRMVFSNFHWVEVYIRVKALYCFIDQGARRVNTLYSSIKQGDREGTDTLWSHHSRGQEEDRPSMAPSLKGTGRGQELYGSITQGNREGTGPQSLH